MAISRPTLRRPRHLGALAVIVGRAVRKLSRTTSRPACIICSRISGELEAGPIVATILVARCMKLLIWIKVDALGETLREPEAAGPAAAAPGRAGACARHRFVLNLVVLLGRVAGGRCAGRSPARALARAAVGSAFAERAPSSLRAPPRSGRPRFQHFHRRQLLPLEELEKAPPRRDVAGLVVDAVLRDGRERVAAARDRERGRFGDRFGERLGAVAELVELEHADRAVPTIVPAFSSWLASALAVSGPMSRIMSSASMSATCCWPSAIPWPSRRRSGSAPMRRARASSMIAFASLTRSASASDLPIDRPAASMNVLAMPPPTISWSTLPASDFRIVSSTPSSRRRSPPAGGPGCRAPCRARRVRRPAAGAHATGAYFAIPWWSLPRGARCQAASFTYTSQSFAIFCASQNSSSRPCSRGSWTN